MSFSNKLYRDVHSQRIKFTSFINKKFSMTIETHQENAIYSDAHMSVIGGTSRLETRTSQELWLDSRVSVALDALGEAELSYSPTPHDFTFL